jgi:hypothetical protein
MRRYAGPFPLDLQNGRYCVLDICVDPDRQAFAIRRYLAETNHRDIERVIMHASQCTPHGSDDRFADVQKTLVGRRQRSTLCKATASTVMTK